MQGAGAGGFRSRDIRQPVYWLARRGPVRPVRRRRPCGFFAPGGRVRPVAARRRHAFRGAQPGGRFDARPGPLLARQCPWRAEPDRGRGGGGLPGFRLLLDLRDLWRPGRRGADRGYPPGADQRLWRIETRHRRNAEGLRRLAWSAVGDLPLLQRGRGRPRGRGGGISPARDTPCPAAAGCDRRAAARFDGAWNGLSDTRRNLHSRLCACLRPGAGACPWT